MLNISLGASQLFNIPQVKILCLALYPTFEGGLFGSLQSTLSSLNKQDIRRLWDVVLVKILFPICWLKFCPLNSVLCLIETLQCYEVLFVNS